jgi:hypothetical protein
MHKDLISGMIVIQAILILEAKGQIAFQEVKKMRGLFHIEVHLKKLMMATLVYGARKQKRR